MTKTLPVRKWVTMSYCYVQLDKVVSPIFVNSYETVPQLYSRPTNCSKL